MYYIIICTYIFSFNIHIYEEEERIYDEANDTKRKHLVTLGKDFLYF